MKKMFWIYLGYTKEGDKRIENVWACSNCGEGLRIKYDVSNYKEIRTDICPRCGLKPREERVDKHEVDTCNRS